MYRRPKFLEVLHEIREEMSREADYDMDLFAEMVRSGQMKNRVADKKFSLPDQSAEIRDSEVSDGEH